MTSTAEVIPEQIPEEDSASHRATVARMPFLSVIQGGEIDQARHVLVQEIDEDPSGNNIIFRRDPNDEPIGAARVEGENSAGAEFDSDDTEVIIDYIGTAGAENAEDCTRDLMDFLIEKCRDLRMVHGPRLSLESMEPVRRAAESLPPNWFALYGANMQRRNRTTTVDPHVAEVYLEHGHDVEVNFIKSARSSS